MTNLINTGFELCFYYCIHDSDIHARLSGCVWACCYWLTAFAAYCETGIGSLNCRCSALACAWHVTTLNSTITWVMRSNLASVTMMHYAIFATPSGKFTKKLLSTATTIDFDNPVKVLVTAETWRLMERNYLLWQWHQYNVVTIVCDTPTFLMCSIIYTSWALHSCCNLVQQFCCTVSNGPLSCLIPWAAGDMYIRYYVYVLVYCSKPQWRSWLKKLT